MRAYTYYGSGELRLADKPRPEIKEPGDAIVRVTLASICTSDLHIKHGSVPRAVPGVTIGHEMVGVVEAVGSGVAKVKPGERVAVNVETYCGECFFCKNGWVNNCTDPRRRLGPRLPHRRRPRRIRPRPARGHGPFRDTRGRHGRAGALHRRHPRHGLLGRQDKRDRPPRTRCS